METLISISIMIIVFIIFEISLQKQIKKTNFYRQLASDNIVKYYDENKIVKLLENKILKMELDLNNKKGTIKFLSDQNIILNNQLQNIEIYYSENSEAIKKDFIKRSEQKLRETLQSSK